MAGALSERGGDLANEFVGSCLMGTGQFCTNPGLVVVPDSADGRQFVSQVAAEFDQATPGTLLSESVKRSLVNGLQTLKQAGANVEAGNADGNGTGVSYRNTLMSIAANEFLKDPEVFQTEAFGNSSLIVLAKDVDEMVAVAESLEGNLTGCVYSDTSGSDDADYVRLEPALRTRVGRLLNDKMPTGVAVSAAMNHGGPFPATGHPGFTAVGIPTSIERFSALYSYDNVRPHRLPILLQDAAVGDGAWRRIDGEWTTGAVRGETRSS